MAVPTIVDDITVFNACDGTPGTGWGVDSTKWVQETQLYIEGTAATGLEPKNTGDGGNGWTGTAFNANTNLVMVWIWVISETVLNTKANHGIYIRLASGSDWTSNYEDYDVGGSDVASTGKGWRLYVLDRASRSADRSAGTLAATAVTRVGVGKNMTSTSNRSTFFAFDNIMYGTKAEITTPSFTDATNGIDFNENGASADTIVRQDAGSFITDGFEAGDLIRVENTTDNDGLYVVQSLTASTLTLSVGDFTTDNLDDTDAVVSAYCTLDDIYQKDGPTDDNWIGIVSKNKDGGLEINYNLVLGDESGGNDCHFVSRGDSIIFTDQPVGSGDLKITTAEDTGTTRVLFGDSSGTGDDRVGFNGSFINSDLTEHGASGTLDLDAGITLLEFYGTTVLNCAGGATFDNTTSTPHKVTNSTFSNCGQVDLGRCESRNLVFAGYSLDGNAALLFDSETDIKNSSFLANTVAGSTIDPHAIEHNADGAYNYNGLTFAGNDYDILNSAASVQMDSYQPAEDGDVDVYSGSITRVAQQFTATAGDLAFAIFSIRKQGTPTGNVYARLYANSGGAPTGAALAESEPINIANLTTSFADITFEFNDEYTMSATDYHISIEYTGGAASNRLEVEYLTAGSGSETCNTYISSWGSQTYDCRFQVNRDGIVRINATDSNPSTYENTGSPRGVTYIINSVNLTINVEDTDGAAIQNVQCAIYRDDTDEELMNEDSTAGGVATEPFNYTTPVDIYYRLRKSSTGATKYVPVEGTGQITANGFTVTVVMKEDEIAAP